jgi:hypothetical protein
MVQIGYEAKLVYDKIPGDCDVRKCVRVIVLFKVNAVSQYCEKAWERYQRQMLLTIDVNLQLPRV